jgi:hypothetical protein
VFITGHHGLLKGEKGRPLSRAATRRGTVARLFALALALAFTLTLAFPLFLLLLLALTATLAALAARVLIIVCHFSFLLRCLLSG